MNKISIFKFLFLILIFLVFSMRFRKQHYYSPMYDFNSDPVFTYIKQSNSKGVILSGYVQSHKGLNVQLATDKQYFVPQTSVATYKKRIIQLHCYDNPMMTYPEFVLRIERCFKERSLEEWKLIAELLESNLVLTLSNVEISTLDKVAKTNDYNLYEIKP